MIEAFYIFVALVGIFGVIYGYTPGFEVKKKFNCISLAIFCFAILTMSLRLTLRVTLVILVFNLITAKIYINQINDQN